MKTKLLLLGGIITVLGSCTSAYRMGQTPDDVYYSPAPAPQEEYVTSNNQQDRDSYGYNNSAQNNIEDLAIRRGINDPMYRSNLSFGFGYGGYSPYDYFGSPFYSPYSSFYSPFSSFYYPYGSFYSPYSYPLVSFYPYSFNYFNSFYSPYFSSYYYPFGAGYYSSKPGNATANYSIGPRRYNLGVYNTGSTPRGSTPGQSTNSNSVPVRTFNTTPANTGGFGGFIRRIFTPSTNTNRSVNRNNATTNNTNTRRLNNNYNRNNNYNNYERNNNYNNNRDNYTPPVRTFQPAPSSGNSGGSSGGGSAPVRTFRR